MLRTIPHCCELRATWSRLGAWFGTLLMTIFYIGTNAQKESTCLFIKNEANCDILDPNLNETNAVISINDCASPVDVTFKIQSSNWTWAHTFVNDDEIQQLSRMLSLHVLLLRAERLVVQANFIYEGRPTPTFINDSAPLPENCSNQGGLVALVVFVVLCVLILAVVVMFVSWRQRQAHRGASKSELLADMERPSLAWPHGVATRVPKSESSTTVNNSVYRDTVMMEETADSHVST